MNRLRNIWFLAAIVVLPAWSGALSPENEVDALVLHLPAQDVEIVAIEERVQSDDFIKHEGS